MESQYAFDSIDKPTFASVLLHYSSPLPASDHSEDDQLRYNKIPDALKARSEDPHLEKDELVALVTWKLKHGVFRPSLKSLVQQNSAEIVESTTRDGFAKYRDGNPKEAIKTLATMRGIGPATASLALSVCDPVKAPFFSDELFRWAFFKHGQGQGWDRQIKYTAKEYDELCEKVAELLERLKVTAVDAEKVAYALGKGLVPNETEPSDSKKRKAGALGNVANVMSAREPMENYVETASAHDKVEQHQLKHPEYNAGNKAKQRQSHAKPTRTQPKRTKRS